MQISAANLESVSPNFFRKENIQLYFVFLYYICIKSSSLSFGDKVFFQVHVDSLRIIVLLQTCFTYFGLNCMVLDAFVNLFAKKKYPIIASFFLISARVTPISLSHRPWPGPGWK